MKNRNVLSGIAALMLVAAFYSFAFCMVEDVDDEPVSMDLYYSTETDAAGERLGEATSAFDANDIPVKVAELIEKYEQDERVTQPVTQPPVKDGSAYAEAPALPFFTTPEKAETEAADKAIEQGEGFLPKHYSPIDDEELSDDGDDEELFSEDDLDEADDLDAENRDVYADDLSENRELSNQETEIVTVTEIPTVPEEHDTIVLTYLSFTDDEPVTSPADLTYNFGDGDNSGNNGNGNGSAVAPLPEPSPVNGETLTARYEGSVHTIDAYELVCMIVNREISTSFNDEAIKAQAVAAYSYVKYHNVNGLTPSVVVKSDPPQRIRELVSSVWGICCYYNGSVAQTVYTASTAGYSASSDNVWGGKVPYLVSVPCPFDVSDPNYGIRTRFTKEAVRTALEGYLGITLSEDPAKWLVINGYCDGSYVSSIDVDGQKTISGRKLRENILNFQLKSASFDIYYSDGYFTFTTYGYGHGVGMSQNGANILAGMGYTYDEILKFYFTGIELL